MSWEVRLAGTTDADLVAETLTALYGSVPDLAYLRAVLADTALAVVLGLDGQGRPAGLAYGYELPRIKRPAAGMLMYEIDVAPQHRRKGLGRMLMEAFDHECSRRGVDRWWLLTDESNGPAMQLYTSLGGDRPNPDDVMFTFRPRETSNAQEVEGC